MNVKGNATLKMVFGVDDFRNLSFDRYVKGVVDSFDLYSSLVSRVYTLSMASAGIVEVFTCDKNQFLKIVSVYFARVGGDTGECDGVWVLPKLNEDALECPVGTITAAGSGMFLSGISLADNLFLKDGDILYMNVSTLDAGVNMTVKVLMKEIRGV